MEVVEVFDLTKSYRAAGQLTGVDHHTVARAVAARALGTELAHEPTLRSKVAEAFADKILEWIERSSGKVRADMVHDKLVAMGYFQSNAHCNKSASITFGSQLTTLLACWVMAAPDFSEFVVCGKGTYFDDFAVGAEIAHHWGRSLTDADNVLFSTTTCNWNPMFLNIEFARAHDHPGALINPMLVLCTVVGLSVEDLSEIGGPFLGLEKCSFHQPVYAGDTVTARSRVIETRESKSRPRVGIVTWATEAHNQRHDLVVEFQRTNLVAKRRIVANV